MTASYSPTVSPSPTPTPTYTAGPAVAANHFDFDHPVLAPSPLHGNTASLYGDGRFSGNLRLVIYNVAGEAVLRDNYSAPSAYWAWPQDLSRLAGGMYFYLVMVDVGGGGEKRMGPYKFAILR